MNGKPKPKPDGLEIKTRQPKKRDLFANLGQDRRNERDVHPLREILDFPPATEKSTDPTLDSQLDTGWIANPSTLGYPATSSLDSQTHQVGYPTQETLDSLIAKTPPWIAKRPLDLDSLIAKPQILDSQTASNSSATGKWVKYDKGRKGKGVFLRTNDDITKRFKQFCIEQGLDYSQATEIAWQRLMESLAIQNPDSLDSLIAHDDRRLMMFKTRPIIINLYRAYNPKNQWKINDDKVACELNDTDIRLIELGIITTQFNARFKRVNSFGYYLTEIQNWCDNSPGEEMLDFLVKHHREQWLKATGNKLQDNPPEAQ